MFKLLVKPQNSICNYALLKSSISVIRKSISVPDVDKAIWILNCIDPFIEIWINVNCKKVSRASHEMLAEDSMGVLSITQWVTSNTAYINDSPLRCKHKYQFLCHYQSNCINYAALKKKARNLVCGQQFFLLNNSLSDDSRWDYPLPGCPSLFNMQLLHVSWSTLSILHTYCIHV